MLKRFVCAAVLGLTAMPAGAQDFKPSSPECIAPANPGGGWDFTCRQVARLLSELGLIDGTMQTVNMPGGQGAVAYANVASRRASDDNLIVATSTVGVTGIAQNRFPGDADTMRWLATLGADVAVVLVPKDSPHETLEDLMNAIREDPASTVAAGSSSIGGWDHLRLLMLAEEAGIEGDALRAMRWVEFDGGGDAVTQLMGGHVGMVVTDVGEIGGFIQSGDVKAIGVMSEERLEAFPDLATAREQGLEVEGYNWRGFYVGGDVSDEAYEGWSQIMAQVFESDEWSEIAAANGLLPVYRGGEEFETFVRDENDRVRDLSRAIGVIQ